jgi:hypothetical protein
VAGIVLTFELGLNWGNYARAVGPILGPIICIEALTAFFLEAGFIGILLYGEGRVSKRVTMVATCLVALGDVAVDGLDLVGELVDADPGRPAFAVVTGLALGERFRATDAPRRRRSAREGAGQFGTDLAFAGAVAAVLANGAGLGARPCPPRYWPPVCPAGGQPSYRLAGTTTRRQGGRAGVGWAAFVEARPRLNDLRDRIGPCPIARRARTRLSA